MVVPSELDEEIWKIEEILNYHPNHLKVHFDLFDLFHKINDLIFKEAKRRIKKKRLTSRENSDR